jgi:hypothetical protein
MDGNLIKPSRREMYPMANSRGSNVLDEISMDPMGVEGPVAASAAALFDIMARGCPQTLLKLVV